MPGVDAIVAVLVAMRKKLEEKLERLYEFNHSSSNNYSTALQLAASITAGLAEVQSGKGFSPVSGTFHSEKLNMEWAKQIQIIIEEKIRKSDNGIGKSVDLEHNVYNDMEGISSENQSINNRFTKEEIQATQKYLEGIKNGTIKGNIGEDFQVETDDYEMEHNIFGQPVGGRRPVLDPFLIGVAKFGFDFLFGDLFTLFDPEATYGEKLLAVGMMTPYGKGVKIVDKLHDLKKVGDVKKATSGSAGIAKGTGKVYPTREIDIATEAHIIDRVKELRGKLTSGYKKSGNFALAEVDVKGIDKSEFFAQSSINELNGTLEERIADISLKPNNPTFKASKAADKNGIEYPRDSDTEYKILNDIANRLGNNTEAKGKIKLFTELDTCDSCSRVIAEFSKKYKNIELEVIHNNGNRLKP